MKVVFSALAVASVMLTMACQQKSGDHDHENGAFEESPNQALYEEVMAIHDEVMPKMNNLYRAKTLLSKQLAESPDLSEQDKKQIRAKIARIEAASEGMMVWMRQFDPLPDSAGEEKAKAYLEDQLIKVKKVREDILVALAEQASDKGNNK